VITLRIIDLGGGKAAAGLFSDCVLAVGRAPLPSH
jgi:hypothetical protein